MVRSDEQDILQGLRLAAVGLVSAVVTATIVIGAGQVWLTRDNQAAPRISGEAAADGRLIRTAG